MDTPSTTRRTVIAGAAVTAAALSIPAPVFATPSQTGRRTMGYATAKGGTKIYYKDWGTGPVVTFSHGWPLTADAWDAQMLFLAGQGFRVIAHDRRGHGRSDQPSDGNDMDGYADDLAVLLDMLDIRGATMVGHSTGGGEVARYIGRYGTARVAKAALISAVPPHLAQSPDNPQAAPISVFDGLRQGLAADRAGFYRDLAMPFFGYNRAGAKVSQAQIDHFWLQGMLGGIKGQYESIKAFSETDFTADLKKMTIPTLILQGDDDQIVPIDLASRRSIKLVPNGRLVEIAGAPHGLAVTHAAALNEALLGFLKG